MSWINRRLNSVSKLPAASAEPMDPLFETAVAETDDELQEFSRGSREVEPEDCESYQGDRQLRAAFDEIKRELHEQIIAGMDLSVIGSMPEDEIRVEVQRVTEDMCRRRADLLSVKEREILVRDLMDEIFGLGPLEPLFRDSRVTDILINGAKTVYVERKGRLELSDVKFIDDEHVLSIVRRIAGRVGRRIDETTPMVDARLPDGSRLNAIVPPL